MLAIRKASARIKFVNLKSTLHCSISSHVFLLQNTLWCLPVSSVTFRACSAKFNLESSSYTDDARLSDPTPHKSDRSRIVKINLVRTRIPFIGTMSFSSQAGTEHIGEDNDDLKDDTKLISNADTFESESEADLSESEDVLDLSDPEEEIGGNNGEGQRGSSGLFKVIINSTSITAEKSLDKWLEEGRDLCRSEISHAMFELRRRRMYGKALQFLEWLESKEKIEFGERDYASRIDLIAKIRGIHKAESYINKIPESFRGEIVYRTLLANAVLNTNTKKAVQIFNRMKDLKLPVTTFACNQLLLLYKRIDKKKIADVLLLMENENVKPSVFTYRLLIETKGQYNDLDGMEQVLETMKSDGMEPDLRLQAVLARQYIYGGVLEKAKSVLKEMEGSNLNVNRKACSYLLSIYALLGSLDDVKRVWGACESDPRLEECTRAIEAFGKLKEVDLAEAVFDKMSKKWEKLSAKNYACMLRVYANNKMLAKGKDLVRRMSDSGCRIGPLTWDALVKLYLESGEIEKADSILNKASQNINVKPLFVTYMMILDDYAKRGDVHNAEKIFNRMRKHGYISRFRQYNSLLLAYINAKVPAYGFRERLKADNVFPSKTLVGQLEQVDAFKKTAVSDLLD